MTEIKEPHKKDHIDSLNFLRGIAAVIVCFCHMGFAFNAGKSSNLIFSLFHDYGKYGVNMFFVISGFVIPLSFERGKYSINNYFTFLYKRLVRLQPPYLIALIITLLIMLASYKVRHVIFPETISTILESIIYLHVPADNPVFWTLAIEAEFYLFIGLLYPLIKKYPKLSICLFIPTFILLSQINFINQNISLFLNLDFFLIGTIGYLIYERKGFIVINYIVLIGLVICCFFFYELAAVISALLTILVILFYKKPLPSFLQFFGTISYSLYLIHFPLTTKIINIGNRYMNSNYQFIFFTIVFTFTSLVSWVMYRLIESPSENLSRKIKYKAFGNFKSEPVSVPTL
jgi:peptidoglycan/LPS O-acetylase OafA/YrhL